MMDKQQMQEFIAKRVAQELQDGTLVNLGIGLPTLVANFVPEGRDVTFQSENGFIGVGPVPTEDQLDPCIANAGAMPVTILPGGSFFDSAMSFGIIRGGHVDVTVLGALQVAENGDLANWHTGAPDAIPAVGGAMDLAVGAKKVFITTDHVTKKGEPKIVAELSYPATGLKCVDRIYTDLCVIDVTPTGMTVIEKVDGLSFEELQAMTGARLVDGTSK